MDKSGSEIKEFEMERLLSLYEVVKSWLSKCSCVILVLCFVRIELPKALVGIATWSIILFFVIDRITMLVGIIRTTSEEEWSATSVISTIISLLTLALSITIYFIGVEALEKASIITEMNGAFGEMQWVAICILIWHFAEEILSLPFSIIALFSEDGEY